MYYVSWCSEDGALHEVVLPSADDARAEKGSLEEKYDWVVVEIRDPIYELN